MITHDDTHAIGLYPHPKRSKQPIAETPENRYVEVDKCLAERYIGGTEILSNFLTRTEYVSLAATQWQIAYVQIDINPPNLPFSSGHEDPM